MTGIGPVAVRYPRVRDRGEGCERIRFSSAILPPCARRSKSLEVLIPILYLKGISSADFVDASGKGHLVSALVEIGETAVRSAGEKPRRCKRDATSKMPTDALIKSMMRSFDRPSLRPT
jgi:hypothetical protein